MIISKRMKKLEEQKKTLDLSSLNNIIEGIKTLQSVKFTESIDLAICLGVNAKKSDENIRGNFILPYGIKRPVKIAAFVPAMMVDEVKKAGADFVGLEDLVEDIKKEGKVNFDVCFATIEALPKIVPISKILGQSGVMPNRKDGTVTKDIIEAIKEVKDGKKCIFKNDDAGYLHISIAKTDMKTENIIENIKEFINYIRTLKPPKVKEMIKKIRISSTMGPGFDIPLRYL